MREMRARDVQRKAKVANTHECVYVSVCVRVCYNNQLTVASLINYCNQSIDKQHISSFFCRFVIVSTSSTNISNNT